MAVLAAAHVRRFGITPKIALRLALGFRQLRHESARKMRRRRRSSRGEPALEVDGEMNGESALVRPSASGVSPHSRLNGEANLLIMPNLDAANIAYQMTKVLGDALPVGPILVGAARPAHILTPSVTARGVVNMTAIAVVEAQDAKSGTRAVFAAHRIGRKES